MFLHFKHLHFPFKYGEEDSTVVTERCAPVVPVTATDLSLVAAEFLALMVAL